jgi:hypothetical protein
MIVKAIERGFPKTSSRAPSMSTLCGSRPSARSVAGFAHRALPNKIFERLPYFLLDFPLPSSVAVVIDGLLQCRHPPGPIAGLALVLAPRSAR